MHPIPLASAAVVLLVSGPSFAQEWTEYIDRTDLVTVSFPTEPEVRDITLSGPEYGITLPGRVHSVEDRVTYRYSVTAGPIRERPGNTRGATPGMPGQPWSRCTSQN